MGTTRTGLTNHADAAEWLDQFEENMRVAPVYGDVMEVKLRVGSGIALRIAGEMRRRREALAEAKAMAWAPARAAAETPDQPAAAMDQDRGWIFGRAVVLAVGFICGTQKSKRREI